MTTFESIHQDLFVGKFTHFDRLIFKGHLSGLYGKSRPLGPRQPRIARFQFFLSRQDVLLKDFKPYAEGITEQIVAHAKGIAESAGRVYRYLESAHTHASGDSKEDLAREIAERDGITEGLVCVLSVLEPCRTFTVRSNPKTQRLEVVTRDTKCLHFYFYLIDPEFGWMHVRLQSWFPFTIQVYINGREWLARQLDAKGISYERHDNKLVRIGDLKKAQQLCDWFAHRKWPRVLHALARWVNPMVPVIHRAGFDRYYWVADQAEIATDLLFRDRATVEKILPDLLRHGIESLGAEDVMRFLGRKLHGNFQGQVTTDLKKRPEGYRLKHRMKRNSIKLYDFLNLLRIETTINNPREFKVLRVLEDSEGRRQRRWCPMGKGVANLWRYREVGRQANQRYLEAMAQAERKGEAVDELDGLCRSITHNGRRVARFQPLSKPDLSLFTAVLSGEHAINGFRNADLRRKLYSGKPGNAQEAKRRCARVSRLIAKLRGHGLVAKVPLSRLYRVTPRGYRVLAAILEFHRIDFPRLRNHAA